MASSFGEAFAKSFQAEMARRKDAEAEIEREIRAEARLNREMQERRAINTESELAQEARAIEAERRRGEREKETISESRLYDKQQKSLADERELNRRMAAVGSKPLGEGSPFQPIESQYGIPATQEQLIALNVAERKLKTDEAAGASGAHERGILGAREQIQEETAVARALGQFGEDATSKPRGYWPRFFAEEDREKAIKTTQFLQDREGTIKLLPKVPRHVLEANKDIWFDSDGALNRKGTYAIPKGFGQIKVEGRDELGFKTGRDHYESVWIPDVPRADSERPPVGEQPGAVQGPMQERTGWGRTSNLGTDTGFLKATEQYAPSSPAIPTLPSQELSEEDQDFFSYLDKVRKHPAVKPVEFISGPGQYAAKLALEGLTESELWKKYGPSDKLRESLTPPWARPTSPATPPIKPWSQDYFTR